MPRTFIPSNSNGWVCAQRRPLRALSHVLLLYDPMYILLADDDTFVSKDILFGSEFKNYVHRR